MAQNRITPSQVKGQGFHIYRSATVTISGSAGSYTAIPLNAAYFDDIGIYNSGNIVVPMDGLYFLSGNAMCSNTSDRIVAAIRVARDGSSVQFNRLNWNVINATVGGPKSSSGSIITYLQAGDVITLEVHQNLASQSVSGGVEWTYLSGARIGS